MSPPPRAPAAAPSSLPLLLGALLAAVAALSLPLAAQSPPRPVPPQAGGRTSALAGPALELLRSNCLECHDWAGSRAAMVAAGQLVPGKPADSELFAMVAGGRMPLAGKRLEPAEVRLLEDWIAAGAPEGP